MINQDLQRNAHFPNPIGIISERYQHPNIKNKQISFNVNHCSSRTFRQFSSKDNVSELAVFKWKKTQRWASIESIVTVFDFEVEHSSLNYHINQAKLVIGDKRSIRKGKLLQHQKCTERLTKRWDVRGYRRVIELMH